MQAKPREGETSEVLRSSVLQGFCGMRLFLVRDKDFRDRKIIGFLGGLCFRCGLASTSGTAALFAVRFLALALSIYRIKLLGGIPKLKVNVLRKLIINILKRQTSPRCRRVTNNTGTVWLKMWK